MLNLNPSSWINQLLVLELGCIQFIIITNMAEVRLNALYYYN